MVADEAANSTAAALRRAHVAPAPTPASESVSCGAIVAAVIAVFVGLCQFTDYDERVVKAMSEVSITKHLTDPSMMKILAGVGSFALYPIKMGVDAIILMNSERAARLRMRQLMQSCKEPLIRVISDLHKRIDDLSGLGCVARSELEIQKPVAAEVISSYFIDKRDMVRNVTRSKTLRGSSQKTLEQKLDSSEEWTEAAKAISETDGVDIGVTPVMAYVAAKQLSGRKYWLDEVGASTKHVDYHEHNLCFMLGELFYWLHVLKQVSFGGGLDAHEARLFENAREVVTATFKTSQLSPLFEVLTGEQRAIGEIMQRDEPSYDAKATPAERVWAARENLLGYSDFIDMLEGDDGKPRDPKFTRWFGQLRNDVLETLGQSSPKISGGVAPKEHTKRPRLPKVCVGLVQLMDYLLKDTDDHRRYPFVEEYRIVRLAKEQLLKSIADAKAAKSPQKDGMYDRAKTLMGSATGSMTGSFSST